MENFSISTYSAQLRIYSASAGPPKAKPAQGSSGTSSDSASGPGSAADAFQAVGLGGNAALTKNQDGDSFTLSLEARIVQISMTRSDGAMDWSGQNADDAAGPGSQSGKSQSDQTQATDSQTNGSFGSGLVKALMQAVGLMGKNGAANNDAQPVPQDASSQDSVTGQGSLHHHHRHMGNPEDVASRVLQHLQQEHAAKGGDLQAFVGQVQTRMENRKSAANGKSDGSSDFRTQVDNLITSGLTAWAQTGGQTVNTQA